LASALDSAVNQTGYDDYEVVVSANGDPDETHAVVERFPSDRVRYFEVGEDVDPQTSWHFASLKCQGEYMLLLADDDALVPDALSQYAATLEEHGNPDYLAPANAWYGHDSVSLPRKNALRFRWQWTAEGMAEPRELLADFFAFTHPTFTPTYSITSSRVRGQLQQRKINPFLVPYPDYGMQACGLAASATACLMKVPTIIHGYAADSGGEISFGRREQVVWTPPDGEEQSEAGIFKHVPLHGYNFINGWAETILRAKELLPDLLEDFEPDWQQYYLRYAQELTSDGEWRNITREFQELCESLQECPEQVRVPLLSSPNMLYMLDWLKRMVDRQLWEHFDPDFKGNWIPGEKHGFSSIVEGSRVAADLLRRQLKWMDLYNSTKPPKV